MFSIRKLILEKQACMKPKNNTLHFSRKVKMLSVYEKNCIMLTSISTKWIQVQKAILCVFIHNKRWTGSSSWKRNESVRKKNEKNTKGLTGYIFPVLLVKWKHKNLYRLCIDFCVINNWLIKINHTLPLKRIVYSKQATVIMKSGMSSICKIYTTHSNCQNSHRNIVESLPFMSLQCTIRYISVWNFQCIHSFIHSIHYQGI